MIKKILIGAVALLFATLAGAVIYSAFQPKPFSWSPTYQSYDKEPYGGYIVIGQLKYFFPNKVVKRMGKDDLNPYYPYILDSDGVEGLETFLEHDDSTLVLGEYYGDLETYNFFALSDEFVLNNRDSKAFMNHLYQGNHALVAAQSISGMLSRLIGIEYEVFDLPSDSLDRAKRFNISINGNNNEATRPYEYLTRITAYPDSATVIANNEAGDVLGVKLKVGKGSLTFFTLPIVFSNYYILKDNSKPAEQLIASLPLEDTRWTNRFVGGTHKYPQDRSILDFIHKQEPLTWAFYTLVFSIILFFLFRIKREQRAIEVVKPPENVSLRFTETISNLYLLRRDNKELTRKKMSFFLEELRSRHNIDTRKIDKRLFKRIASKFNVRDTLPKHIFELYDSITQKDIVTDEEFLRFNNLIQTFKQKKNG